MVRSHSFHWSDLRTSWYKRWASELLQDEKHRENFALYSNKFWQNAVIAQALWERGVLAKGKRGIGFGVGQERLPALFAKYGVYVMATDQDFTTQEAGHWAEHELAESAQSLNRLKICSPKKFNDHVSYMPANMKKIPKSLAGMYDFLWSNCALGHLGSIPAGLAFIESSLRCLVPGGWAVHTTELNILSDTDTVEGGDTVIFRLRDIHDLEIQLIEQGYEVSSFALTYGKQRQDKRISLMPQFGNDFSKIRVQSHLATQIVLIIRKPLNFEKDQGKSYRIKAQKLKARTMYRLNLVRMRRYTSQDPTLRRMEQGKQRTTGLNNISPFEQEIHVTIPKKTKKKIKLAYENNSGAMIMGVTTPISAQPVVLATFEPTDRASKFADSSWPSSNRPSTTLCNDIADETRLAEMVQPGTKFYFELTLNAGKSKTGTYEESFCLVQEQVGWIHDSVVRVTIDVV